MTLATNIGIAGVFHATPTEPETRVLFIPGVPAPSGSKTGFPIKRKNGSIGVAMADASKRSRPWKALVTAFAADGWRTFAPIQCAPVGIRFDFTMPRPKHHYGTRKGERYLKDAVPLHHTGKPDALKLARACEDALIGIAYADDAQIAEEFITKRYGDRPGVRIEMWEMK